MDLNKLLTIPIEDLTFSVVDTETTGMYSKHNRIMDIGIVRIEKGKVVSKWETLIDPKQEVAYWITKFTGLRDRDVVGKPVFKYFANDIKQKLDDTIFVAHNVGFDYSFLYEEFKRLGIDFDPPSLCTVQLARKLLPQMKSANLDVLSDYYKIEITKRHRALPDAEATAIIFLDLVKKAQEKYKARTYFDLDKLQKMKVSKKYNAATGNNYLLNEFSF